MAIRLRLKADGTWQALCAAESMPLSGDVYLNDAQDHALREKLFMDWRYEEYGPSVSQLVGMHDGLQIAIERGFKIKISGAETRAANKLRDYGHADAAQEEPKCNCDAGERPWRFCELHEEEQTN